ncbi:Cytochrome P450 monooxygenase boa7 [Clarireedia jacksonii]
MGAIWDSNLKDFFGIVGLILIAAIIAYYTQRPNEELLLKRLENLGIPVVGKGPQVNVSEALEIGSTKYPETPWILPVDRVPIVILPHSIINSIKSLPEGKISFEKDVYARHLAHLVLREDQKVFSDAILNSIKQDLTRNIAKTLDTLWDEVEYAFEKNIGSLPADEEDWKTVPVYGKVLGIVAILSGRVFVGAPLCREDEWIQATIAYTLVLSGTVGLLWKRPWWQRPFLAPIYFRTLNSVQAKAEKMLQPLLEREAGSSGWEKKIGQQADGQLISWLVSHTPRKPDGTIDLQELARNQLIVSLAAIHTTSITISHILYDLAAYPEYVAPLRGELEAVIAENRSMGGNGKLTKVELTKLWKMDSFIKESQRMNPPIIVQMRRYLTAPLTLPSGHTLPAGTFCGVDAQATNRNVPYYDASPTRHRQEPFDKFDGFRFSKLRSVPGNEHRYQFVTSSTESLNFGHGTHACPGRFFASNEIKIAFAEVLMRWDVRLKPGEGRPANLFTDTNVMPNMKGEVQMRRRV